MKILKCLKDFEENCDGDLIIFDDGSIYQFSLVKLDRNTWGTSEFFGGKQIFVFRILYACYAKSHRK